MPPIFTAEPGVAPDVRAADPSEPTQSKSPMSTLGNIWKIKELRSRIVFTLALIFICRLVAARLALLHRSPLPSHSPAFAFAHIIANPSAPAAKTRA